MRKADEQGFREFAAANAASLRRTAYLFCGDWHTAEDLMQSSLMKMYMAWKRIKDLDNLIAYARKVLLRTWLDEKRRPWRRAEQRDGELPDAADATVDPDTTSAKLWARELVHTALLQVPPRQRAVLVLRYFEDLSVAEVAVEHHRRAAGSSRYGFGGLLRLARLSRLFRITRLMRGQQKKELVEEVIRNRNQYTAFITILMAWIVLTLGSTLVLQFESKNPNASIQTGWDAFWYSVVTITTVGYGDFYPITYGGRIIAIFIMFMGVGIIGALASILSSILVGTPAAAEEEEPPASGGELPPAELAEILATKDDMAALQNEIASLRLMLEKMSGADGHKQIANLQE